jgi:hypothetical protein
MRILLAVFGIALVLLPAVAIVSASPPHHPSGGPLARPTYGSDCSQCHNFTATPTTVSATATPTRTAIATATRTPTARPGTATNTPTRTPTATVGPTSTATRVPGNLNRRVHLPIINRF